MRTLVRSAFMAVALLSAAKADALFVSFSGPGIGVAGSSVALVATATNISGVEQSLDGLGYTLVSPFVDFDDTEFITNWPLTLDATGPGAEFGPAAIFQVLIPLGTAPGTYTGNVLNVFGEGGGTLLTSQTFDIEVVEDVPEPGTLSLISGGIAALALIRRSRRKRQLS